MFLDQETKLSVIKPPDWSYEL